jgi:aspartyl-tRNA(Asn)/glutamyl-tRNA(Gln) amidotransferase subunit C
VSVTPDDVKHVAALARLAMTDDRAVEFTAQLNTILDHMDVLSKVNTDRMEPVAGIGAAGMPLGKDEGPPPPLASALDAFAPAMRDGFFLVPRLASHDAGDEG